MDQQTRDRMQAAADAIPESARQRLTEMRGRLATSDLSVNELLMVREAGFEPLGFVMGASVYHMPPYSGGLSNFELEDYSQGTYCMRDDAMLRMEAEAAALGADGIVGVHFKLNLNPHVTNGWEFMAFGTAVKASENNPLNDVVGDWRNNRGMPFTSDLSGQAFWTLLKAGYTPCGFVMGTCVWHIGYQNFFKKLTGRWKIRELPEYTQSIYSAREVAMERMQAEAEGLHANLVTEFHLTEFDHWGNHVMEFLAVGTAVRPISRDHTIKEPVMVFPLTG